MKVICVDVRHTEHKKKTHREEEEQEQQEEQWVRPGGDPADAAAD